ncbi:MAG: hypothetical protein A2275_12085 [Bacteroidetes bacterium RIFOXYA12_FULL_35_11]|nr:MAG: hypothetical protein A2X01_12955 [Bacteroidetes bacterium GWF2_35_48]OFY73628.1 MAG: hypothetical protein A2275_12085 [Bacteroidetes bacterium RIFOXYA12_FULL_35_11]OFY94610.1 MAG: hypothetical protein A2309_08455 [Bacteroidetes bacterium RIFOXYB2_FULL_35_7]HBX52405.1 hypothetical protein [Bacteroidales bacterium]
MDKIILPDNHKRALTSALFVIEKLGDELIHDLEFANKKVITQTEQITDLESYKEKIERIRMNIKYVFEKYNLSPGLLSKAQIINSRKTKMWEVLCDSKASKLNVYGQFPMQYQNEFDEDIEALLKLTESI